MANNADTTIVSSTILNSIFFAKVFILELEIDKLFVV